MAETEVWTGSGDAPTFKPFHQKQQVVRRSRNSLVWEKIVLGSGAMCLPALPTRWQREVCWRVLLSSIPMCQPGRLGSSLLSWGQYE